MKIFKLGRNLILSIWNPFPRIWKFRWKDGTPVLDIRQRRINKLLTEAEIKRRLANKEDIRKCFKIQSRSTIDFTGRSA